MQIPADAPRSDDGHYWWDGTAWQLVDASAAAAQPAASAAAVAAPAAAAEGGAAADGTVAGAAAAEGAEGSAAQLAPPVIATEAVAGDEAVPPDVQVG